MLALFRTNQLFLSILLIFYVAALHIAAFVFPDAANYSNPGIFSQVVYDWIGNNSTIANILSIILLCLQGILINVVVAENRLTKEVNLFPGLIYILVASLFLEFLHLSPLHLANTFLIIVLMEVMATYKKPNAADRIFNAGFWTAVASLFYFSYSIFLILIFVALNILRAFNFKERLMYLVGATVPYILSGIYYFWHDQLDYFIKKQFAENISYLDFQMSVETMTYVKIGLFSILILAVLLSYGSYTFKQNIQIQKKISILFWAIIIGAFSVLFQSKIQLDHLLILAVPIGFLFSFNFTNMSSRFAELLHFFILVIVFVLQYQSFIFG